LEQFRALLLTKKGGRRYWTYAVAASGRVSATRWMKFPPLGQIVVDDCERCPARESAKPGARRKRVHGKASLLVEAGQGGGALRYCERVAMIMEARSMLAIPASAIAVGFRVGARENQALAIFLGEQARSISCLRSAATSKAVGCEPSLMVRGRAERETHGVLRRYVPARLRVIIAFMVFFA